MIPPDTITADMWLCFLLGSLFGMCIAGLIWCHHMWKVSREVKRLKTTRRLRLTGIKQN